MIQQLCVIIESYNEETKSILINFDKKKESVKWKIFIFHLHFY